MQKKNHLYSRPPCWCCQVEEQTVPGEEQRGRENKRRKLAQHNRMSGKRMEV